MTRALEIYLGWDEIEVLWLVVPLGFGLALLVNPVGDFIRRLWFSKRRGCYETLLQLSERMSTILNVETLIETLVRGLVHGVPLTHGVVLIYEKTRAFVARRGEATVEGLAPASSTPTARSSTGCSGRAACWCGRRRP